MGGGAGLQSQGKGGWENLGQRRGIEGDVADVVAPVIAEPSSLSCSGGMSRKLTTPVAKTTHTTSYHLEVWSERGCTFVLLYPSRGQEPAEQPVDNGRSVGPHRRGHLDYHHHHSCTVQEE